MVLISFKDRSKILIFPKFQGYSSKIVPATPSSQGHICSKLPFLKNSIWKIAGLQKKCILVAEKNCYLQEQSSKLFFSLRLFLFSLIKLFFFSIWTVKTSLHSVLTTIQISKKKNLIAENKISLSEKKLRLRALFFQSNVFPATRNIYSSIPFFYLSNFGKTQIRRGKILLQT